MPNMKTDMNHNLSTHIIGNIKRMEDCEHTVRLISVIIECLRNNAMEKAQGFQKVIFCIKGLKNLYIKGVVR